MCKSVVIADREKYRSDYEEKLRSELEQIRVRTDAEIDRLKTSTREMYERENRFDSRCVSLMTLLLVVDGAECRCSRWSC